MFLVSAFLFCIDTGVCMEVCCCRHTLAASLPLWALRGLCAWQVRVFAKQLAKDGMTVNTVIPVRIP